MASTNTISVYKVAGKGQKDRVIPFSIDTRKFFYRYL